MTELLLGAGNNHERKLSLPGYDGEWEQLVTVDIDEASAPDVIHDLNVTPWPFDDNAFSEVHAYEVLEHLGRQGDYLSFFATFTEIWRILTPGGMLIGTSPLPESPWAWGDPGHTRIISKETFTFLDQTQYAQQIGVTAMSDYRAVYSADFQLIASSKMSIDSWGFALTAHKPARIAPPIEEL